MYAIDYVWTNIGHIRVDYREVIGRVESGTETEKMSGTYFPDKVEESREAIRDTYAISGLVKRVSG